MHLLPRLSREECRTHAAQFREDDQDPTYRTAMPTSVLNHFRRVCQAHKDVWLGLWVWSDGMVAMVPVPPEGTALPDWLAEIYECVRTAFELQLLGMQQVLLDFPPSGRA